MARYTTLYIPGVGGARADSIQQSYIRFLNIFKRRKTAYFLADWMSGETYDDKFARLVSQYEKLGSPPVIFGVSAGASLAVVLAARKQEARTVHLVCGKVLGANKIGPNYSSRYTALIDSVTASQDYGQAGLINKNVTCYRPLFDEVVELEDMVVTGARLKRLPIVRHTPAIVYSWLRYLPFIG